MNTNNPNTTPSPPNNPSVNNPPPQTQFTHPSSNTPSNEIMGFLELYLIKKAPALPNGFKSFVVALAPYLNVIGLVIALPAILLFFGLSAIALPIAALGGVNSGTSTLVSIVFVLGSFVLEVVAIPGLFKKTKFAWNMIFYAELIAIVSGFMRFSLFSSIIFPLIFLYVLFQVKEYYT